MKQNILQEIIFVKKIFNRSGYSSRWEPLSDWMRRPRLANGRAGEKAASGLNATSGRPAGGDRASLTFEIWDLSLKLFNIYNFTK